MKITLISNLSANGKVLLAENPNHKSPKGGEEFFINKVIQSGNLILGSKTFEVIKKILGGDENFEFIFPNVEIVILTSKEKITNKYKLIATPQKVIEYLKEKGFKEIIIGGGTTVYNSFLEKDLVTDLYLNYVPIIIGYGGILGQNENLFMEFKLIKTTILEGGIIQSHLERMK